MDGPTNGLQKSANGRNVSNGTMSFKEMQVLQNPVALKQMHKNMSVAQLNQPHLQGSFLNNLQVNSNHTQMEIMADSS